MASSLARPPALRTTCASPSLSPAYLAGSSRASMQVRIAKRRAGGRARLPFDPNELTYSAFAERTSSSTFDITCPLESGKTKSPGPGEPGACARADVSRYVASQHRAQHGHAQVAGAHAAVQQQTTKRKQVIG